MKKFEYKAVMIWGAERKTTKRLNELGEEGWELVSSNWIWFYLKREKQ
jgi:hypothetical protein